MLTSGKTQTYQNYKIKSYSRLDTVDIALFEFTNKRVKEHDSGIFDDKSKEIFIQFELSRAKRI